MGHTTFAAPPKVAIMPKPTGLSPVLAPREGTPTGTAGKERPFTAGEQMMRVAGNEGPLMSVAGTATPDRLSVRQVVNTMPSSALPKMVAPVKEPAVLPSGPAMPLRPAAESAASAQATMTRQVAQGVSQIAMAPIAQASAPGISGASSAEVNALRLELQNMQGQYANALTQLGGAVQAMGEQIANLNLGVGQAMSAASTVDENMKTLAANVQSALKEMTNHIEGNTNALTALARGATESFTPRQIVVPVGSPNVKRMPTTCDTNQPVGIDETLNAKQDRLVSKLAGWGRRR